MAVFTACPMVTDIRIPASATRPYSLRTIPSHSLSSASYGLAEAVVDVSRLDDLSFCLWQHFLANASQTSVASSTRIK